MDLEGFSDRTSPTVIPSLSDMSNFNKLVDRMQQGFVNFMYLSRALIHPDGFADDPEFQMENGASGSQSVIDTNGGRALYMGISQGAIMGGALTALEPNVDQSVLNVPGMNYSTLLRRSVDSDEYFRCPASASTTTTRASSSDRCCSRWSSCSGIGARPTATPTT